ncbi:MULTISPECIES: hypothetical protein [unclassified Oleiphilus]|uniref:hypothetical protein n=1 Tax=unclassified Oleiphilus TaxID=2631174 RepID=UPI0007C3645C|nr:MULTISPECIES: hypothetical protein [unclassified Oleiphilus]KZY66687.1 hypothetical protein A3738_05835 [Oleiphilus sp. HI0066]KZY66864.1 hypothetical protein A3738_16300 [Oleiphilus sp. HI0066]KZY67722.1 hypothetical protein A3739_21105 [Oleiphilus sp. HI0067]KZY73116.1 hypothetical protein A3739_03025 [Oleiphilus sp. HI0067]
MSRVISFVFLSLCFSTMTLAENSFQFAVYGAGASISQDNSGSGKFLGLSATAYLDPIMLDGSKPLALAAKYQQVSSVFAYHTQLEYSDLAQVRGGRILETVDNDRTGLGGTITHESIPLWLSVNHVFSDDAELGFRDGTTFTNSDSMTEFELGVYASEHMIASLIYNDAVGDTYGLTVDALFELADLGQFIELSALYLEIEHDEIDLSVVNNTVRNLDTNPLEETQLGLGVTYFPTKAIDVGLTYTSTKLSHGPASKELVYSLNAGWFFSQDTAIRLEYALFEEDTFFIDSSVSAELLYRF